MMSTATDPAARRYLASDPPDLIWQSWPLLDGAPWSWCVPPGLCVVGWMVSTTTGHVSFGILAAVSLALALWRWFVPARYEIGPSGVSHRVLGWRSKLRWSDVRHIEVRSRGVLLFRHGNRSQLDALNATYLPCATHRDVVLRLMEKYLNIEDTKE
jgi:hypothetical protein